MSNLVDLDRFAMCDDEQAAEAFERLAATIRTVLGGYLSKYVACPDDREDVINQTILKLWEARNGFRNKGEKAWNAYVRRTAIRCTYDLGRSRKPPIAGLDEVGEIPEEDMPYVDAIVETIAERQGVFLAADELWLLAPQSDDQQRRDRRLLAAQLFYLHRMDWQDVLSMVSPDRSQKRADLDALIGDASAVLQLGYGELYRSNDDLVSHFLFPGEETDVTRIDEISAMAVSPRDDTPPRGWTWAEVRILFWRYRNGLVLEQILRFKSYKPTKADVEALLERCANLAPFRSRANRLREGLMARSRSETPLKEQGIWRRIVFQYVVADTIPLKQIQERIQPAAQVFGFTLSDATLNSWTSGGRLFAQLADYLSRVRACD